MQLHPTATLIYDLTEVFKKNLTSIVKRKENSKKRDI